MKDIQSQRDDRRVNIRKVGVKTISYPITLRDKAYRHQRTVATVNMYVNLPHRFKGTHMSRFVEILNRFHESFNLKNFHKILDEMKHRLDAEAAHVEIEFPYFFSSDSEDSPLSTKRCDCRLHGSLDSADDLVMEIRIPISLPLQGGARSGMPRSMGHWGRASVAIRCKRFFWIEELVELVEKAISEDRGNGMQETAAAREHDFFSVESISRRLGLVLATHSSIDWFSVTVENLADGYNIFASLEWP